MRKIFSGLFLLILAQTGFSRDYFQQDVAYTIHVKLNDTKHELSGTEELKYKNNSPDVLPFLYFHIWPNAYKNNNTALAKQLTASGNLKFHFAKDSERGYIDSLHFQVNGQDVQMELDPVHIDICKIILKEPLKPGEEITITTPFHVKIPSAAFSRLGHIDQSYQITQWYPKPAVYDVNGWNQMPYLNQGEFYSEFGTYDVFITLPMNYVVGATGDLVNGENELAWLDQKVKETEAITEIKKKDLSFPASSPELKTLHYYQKNVHDFAWFTDKRYHVLKGEVKLPHSGKMVTTWTMFTDNEFNLWKKSIEYMNDAIYYYSLWNGDYQYQHATAIDGTISAGAGMEYPNVTNIGTSGSASSLEVVIMHEVGHNWFYGMLGSQERVHPWMDEGINSFNELRYIKTKYPDKKLVGERADSKAGKVFDFAHIKQKAQYELIYLLNARRNMDQPIEFPAHEYTEINYGGIVYSKTALVFDYLRSYLGDAAFDKAMQAYFDEWKFKHPMPSDLRKSIETSTGKKLDWFFEDLIKTTKKVDFKITDVKMTDQGYPAVTIKNKGDVSSPVMICGVKDGKIKSSIWYETQEMKHGKMQVAIPPGNYDKIMIDYPGDIPEVNRKNNSYKLHGLFKKTEPLRLQFLGAIENPARTQLFYSPMVGWNQYDKFMAGVAIYNHFFPERKFQYTLAPMYSFDRKTISGFASVSQTFYPRSVFQNIRFSVSGRKFSMPSIVYTDNTDYKEVVTRNPNSLISLQSGKEYFKITPQITFDIKKKREISPIQQKITLRNVFINEDLNYLDHTYNVAQAVYALDNTKKLNPYSFSFTAEFGEDYSKLFATASKYISYSGKKNKGLDIRFFAGSFIDKTQYSRYMFGYGFTTPGVFDYTYDHLYFGRYEHSQQFVEKDGGFKHETYVLSNSWLTTLNFNAALPGKLPLSVYTDVGISEGSNGLVYETGAKFSLIKNICEVYFPIYLSHPNTSLSYMEKVRFTFNIHLADPFEITRNFSM
jgi:hypothetical protein